MTEVFLQIRNVSKAYGKTEAIRNVNADVKKGELFGFIGPDGGGKTTLFRIIASLILPDTGEVKVSGLDVIKDYKDIRNMVGYMPGRFSLYQDLTVEENLKFYATIFGTTVEENYHLIKDIYSHIEPFKTRLAGKLSGGMKQKLALSCALIHKPELLILDEPTTGVDAVSRVEFWDMLSKLKEGGITIIVSTPYMDEAERCDRVALIQNGDVLKIDSPEGIIKGFENDIYALRSTNIYKLLKDLRSYPHVASAFPFGQEVHFVFSDVKEASAEALNAYLHDKGHIGLEIKKIEAGIEDCFMDLMIKKASVAYE